MGFLEFTFKVSWIIVPDFDRYRLYWFKRCFEKLACFFYPGPLEILGQWNSHIALEKMAETRAREGNELGYLGYINVTMKIVIDKRNGNTYFRVHSFVPVKETIVGCNITALGHACTACEVAIEETHYLRYYASLDGGSFGFKVAAYQ